VNLNAVGWYGLTSALSWMLEKKPKEGVLGMVEGKGPDNRPSGNPYSAKGLSKGHQKGNISERILH